MACIILEMFGNVNNGTIQSCMFYIYTHIMVYILYVYIATNARIRDAMREIHSFHRWLVGWFVWLMLLCISTFSERLLLSNNAEMLDECEHRKVLLE